MDNENSHRHDGIGAFQIVILILSFVVIAALIADTAFKLPVEVSVILQRLDTLICIVFLVDFLIRYRQADSKLSFMKWGWIDLVASIPNLPVLRIGRLIRVLRIIRLLRALRASHKISKLFFRDRIQAGIASVILTTILLLVFSSLGILICEQPDPQSNIRTADDAIWWSITTITTVGYGDRYPVTAEGRLIAMMLMVSGMGLFGGLSGLAASFFLGSRGKSLIAEENKILARLEKLEAKIDGLNRTTDRQ
jgi:voltage-gated potassium channel